MREKEKETFLVHGSKMQGGWRMRTENPCHFGNRYNKATPRVFSLSLSQATYILPFVSLFFLSLFCTLWSRELSALSLYLMYQQYRIL